MALIEARQLVKRFPVRSGLGTLASLASVVSRAGRAKPTFVHAVNGVDLDIEEGECVGLVGESGCGKSTLGRLLVRLIEPSEGSIRFAGQDITRMPYRELRPLKRQMQIIFQDPYASLNPRMTVEAMLAEVLHFHQIVPAADVSARIDALLAKVGLGAEARRKYPHEFSGGQRQRIGIARALAVEPRFILADEPVSALDVSIQAQILNLLQELRESLSLTYLFVSHDLGVVQHMCDRVEIMYLGAIVERLPCRDLEADVRHPYSRALLGAVPKADPRQRGERPVLEGDVPSPMDLPRGCAFASRCPHANERCRNDRPALKQVAARHQVACHAVEEQRI